MLNLLHYIENIQLSDNWTNYTKITWWIMKTVSYCVTQFWYKSTIYILQPLPSPLTVSPGFILTLTISSYSQPWSHSNLYHLLLQSALVSFQPLPYPLTVSPGLILTLTISSYSQPWSHSNPTISSYSQPWSHSNP